MPLKDETRYVIVPITVKKMTKDDLSSGDNTFSVPSIYCGNVINYVSPFIDVTGSWGNYTNVQCGTMSSDKAPVTGNQLIDTLSSKYRVMFSGDYSNANIDGVSLTEEDAQELRVKTSSAIEGNLFRIDLNINGTIHLLGEMTGMNIETNAYSITIDCTSLGVNSNIKATIILYLKTSDTDPYTYIIDTERTKLYVSTL